MFPIPFNIPFRKKDGSLSTLGDELNNGGGGSSYTLPTASASVKGGVKIGAGLEMDGEVLKNTNPTPSTPYSLPTASADTLGGVKIGSGINIDENGVISSSGGSGADMGIYSSLVPYRAIFKDSGENDGKYVIAVANKIPSETNTPNFTTDSYDFNEVFDPSLSFTNYEYYNYVTDDFLTDIGAVLLCDHKSSNATSGTLTDSINNYDIVIIQGCYDSTAQSNYDTTMIYLNPELNVSYWFGVKDRNSSYSATMQFTSNTEVQLSTSKRFMIYGVPKSV